MTVAERLKIAGPVSVSDDEFQTQTVYVSFTGIITSPPDATTLDQMNAVQASGAIDFWNDPEEDGYTGNDGDAA